MTTPFNLHTMRPTGEEVEVSVHGRTVYKSIDGDAKAPVTYKSPADARAAAHRIAREEQESSL